MSLCQMAEQLVEVPETVSRDGVQQRIVEQIVDAPVMQAMEELAEVSKVFSQDRIQRRIVEQIIPATSLAEMIIDVPVVQTPEKTQQAMNTYVQHVVDTVEVERPTIIDGTVQKPIIQEKINQVTQHVEVPLSQFNDKVVDNPVVAQRQIPMVYVEMKTAENPQLQIPDDVIDVPAVLVVPVPQVQVSGKTVEISQLQTAEKIVDTFDANGNRVANKLRRRDCVMREMRKNKLPFRLALNRADPDEIARHCKYCNERGVTRLYESGTALAEGMRVPVSKMEKLIAARCQTSMKMVKDPDRRPYPAYPSGKSWCEACGKMGSGQKFYHNVTPGSDSAAEAQQQHKSSKHQPTKKSTRQERGGERKEEERDQEGRKEEEKEVEDGGEQVEKDVTGWTEVTRNKRKKRVQIFVKVDEMKMVAMDVSPEDKVQKILNTVSGSERDVYVTSGGRILRGSDKLKNFGVRDGSTVEVTSRMRGGGGKHREKKSKIEKEWSGSPKKIEQAHGQKVEVQPSRNVDEMYVLMEEQMRLMREEAKGLHVTGEVTRRIVEHVVKMRLMAENMKKQASDDDLKMCGKDGTRVEGIHGGSDRQAERVGNEGDEGRSSKKSHERRQRMCRSRPGRG